MKKLFILLMLAALMLGSTAFADYRPATASPTPPPNGWVRGVVTDSADATLKLSDVTVSTDGKTIRTDAQGEYVLELRPGTYELTFTKEGYVPVTLSVQVNPAQESIHNCVMTLEHGWIRGTVKDSMDNTKLAGVTVSTGGMSVQTDAQGKYELQLQPGSWELTFMKDGYLEAKHTVQVRATKETTKNCELTPRQGWVRGTVTDSVDTSKLAGVTVSANGVSVQTNAQGKYELKLEPGSCELTFSKDGYLEAKHTVQVNSGRETTKNCSLTSVQGWVYGVVSDATNPSIKISGVTVTVNGQTVQTNSRGEYEMKVEPGTVTVKFSKDGYIQTEQSVQVQSGRKVKADCFMSKELASNQYRVVLYWGTQPADLDSHLLGTSNRNTAYHICFPSEYKKPEKAYGEAELDTDDTNGEGPETVTFTVTNNRTYVYYVHDYSNQRNSRNTQLASSGAWVEVYRGNQRIKVYYVPSGTGIYWEVFRIRNGELVNVNKITNAEPTR